MAAAELVPFPLAAVAEVVADDDAAADDAADVDALPVDTSFACSASTCGYSVSASSHSGSARARQSVEQAAGVDQALSVTGDSVQRINDMAA